MQAFDITSEENPSFVGETSPLHLSEVSCTPVVVMHRRWYSEGILPMRGMEIELHCLHLAAMSFLSTS